MSCKDHPLLSLVCVVFLKNDIILKLYFPTNVCKNMNNGA